MRIVSLKVHNYKSLRNVHFRPGEIVCLVGPNAAGKTNFTDSVEFLSEVYTYGLETAIARKGGYENIAFRRARRSKADIAFEIEVLGTASELRSTRIGTRSTSRKPRRTETLVRFRHRFEFKAKGSGYKAEFKVTSEKLHIALEKEGKSLASRELTLRIRPDDTRYIVSKSEVLDLEVDKTFQSDFILNYVDDLNLETGHDVWSFPPTTLMTEQLGVGPSMISDFSRFASQWQLFRLSPKASRLPGVPTPNPMLSESGENLPALVDWIRNREVNRWETVLDGMKAVMPTLAGIDTVFLQTKTLGLVFEEHDVSRPWSSSDVSDGTIQALGLLIAAVDPRSTMLVIEEMENSLHPWVIRTLLDRIREISSTRAVILTTHSPLVVNSMRPSEVWIVSRTNGETAIRCLTDIDETLEKEWSEGRYQISELLDSGIIGEAVPGGAL